MLHKGEDDHRNELNTRFDIEIPFGVGDNLLSKINVVKSMEAGFAEVYNSMTMALCDPLFRGTSFSCRLSRPLCLCDPVIHC